MMPTFPAQTNQDDPAIRNGFTFVEVIVALAIVCIIVTATASALITVLRMDMSGNDMTAAVLAMKSTVCHHLIPASNTEGHPLNAPFISNAEPGREEPWTIYTLTPSNDSGSITVTLALHPKTDFNDAHAQQ